MITIYLCGPMTGHTSDSADDWRNKAIEDLNHGFIVLSPTRVEVGKMAKEAVFTPDGFGEKSNIPSMRPSAIYSRDMFDLEHCDIVLANMSDLSFGFSIGSTYEMGYAKALKKLVLLVAPPDNPFRVHAISSQAADTVFDTLEDALDYIKQLCDPYRQPVPRTGLWLRTAG